MADLDDDELLDALGVDATPLKASSHTPREERIIAGFEDILRFHQTHGRAPQHSEGGDIFDFLQLTTSQLAIRPRAGKLTLLQRIRRGAEQANDRLHARSNVHHHYDLTVDFYRLFLDEDLQYSCAFFETPDMTLDQAQVAKKRRLIDKLVLSPGQSALDIGCGWGGLGLSMAERGARVTGVTLSTEQHRTANERAAKRGLSDRAEFRLQDYRDLNQTFELLLSGRIDATLNAEMTFYDYTKEHPDANVKIAVLTDDANQIAIPMRKGDETAALRTAIDAAIDELRADGTLKALSEKYFGRDISTEE